MPTTIEKLIELEPHYEPSAHVMEALRAKQLTVATIIGPFGTGKSRVIRAATQQQEGIEAVQSFTTRRPRTREHWSQYDFAGDRRESIARSIQSANAVQYTVAPFNNEVYGSFLRGYTEQRMLVDVLAQALHGFERLPLQRLVKVAFVAEPMAWDTMSARRHTQVSRQELQGRLQEGYDSLTYSLEQGDEIAWVINSYGSPEPSARHVVGLLDGTTDPLPDGRQVGERLRAHIGQLLAV